MNSDELSIKLNYKICMRLFHLVFIALVCHLSILHQNQNELILKVFNEETLQPLQSCYILVNNTVVGETDINGLYKPSSQLYQSKIVINHISCIDKEIDLSMLPSDTISIPLKARQYEIAEVVVTAKKRKIKYEKMGIYKRKARKNTFFTINGKLALYIPNKKNSEQFIIDQLSIYITNRGNPKSPFLCSIYAGEKEYIQPNDSLRLLRPILLQADRGDEYLKVNLYQYKIAMPSNGLFVVLENPKNFIPEYKTKRFGNITGRLLINSIDIGHAWEEVNKFYEWNFNKKNGWKRDTIYWENYPKRDAVQHSSPMIYVKLRKVEKE